MNSAGAVGKDIEYRKRSGSRLDLLELLIPEADYRRNRKRKRCQLAFIEHLFCARSSSS